MVLIDLRNSIGGNVAEVCPNKEAIAAHHRHAGAIQIDAVLARCNQSICPSLCEISSTKYIVSIELIMVSPLRVGTHIQLGKVVIECGLRFDIGLQEYLTWGAVDRRPLWCLTSIGQLVGKFLEIKASQHTVSAEHKQEIVLRHQYLGYGARSFCSFEGLPVFVEKERLVHFKLAV